MEKVTMNVQKLLEKVVQNRENHKKLYASALEGYRKQVAEALTRMSKLANQNQDVNFYELHQLDKPKLHLKEYDRVISMLNQHTNATVELKNQDFGRYFEDDWEWKEQWVTSNSKYTGNI